MTLTKPQQLFVEALKSGQYEQCQGQLADEFGAFCVLGVACDLAMKHGIITRFDGEDGNLTKYPEVQKWLGLDTQDGDFYTGDPFDGECDSGDLAELNDNGHSFAVIAERIEQGLLFSLFTEVTA